MWKPPYHVYTDNNLEEKNMSEDSYELKVEILINDLLAERNMSLRELARISGIEPSNLSNLANGKRKKIYLEHIERIADALEIEDISKIIKLERK